jgi:hypothetical protein
MLDRGQAEGYGSGGTLMTFTTGNLIAEAEYIAARAKRRLRRYRHQLGERERQLLDVGDVPARATRAERELQRIDLYRAILKSGPTEQALMPEYVLTRWSRDWRRPTFVQD